MKTIRQQMIEQLSRAEMGARELSAVLGVREKEVAAHLEHIARSLSTQGKQLVIRPCLCLLCGYEFSDRRRFTRPGRCPRCRRSHLQPPRFRIV